MLIHAQDSILYMGFAFDLGFGSCAMKFSIMFFSQSWVLPTMRNPSPQAIIFCCQLGFVCGCSIFPISEEFENLDYLFSLSKSKTAIYLWFRMC